MEHLQKNRSLPTLFVSHGGGPWPWMNWGSTNPYKGLATYLKTLPDSLGAVPRAILVISGHWEEQQFTVMTHAKPPMLYDYTGFPENTYHVRYDAPGSPSLAQKVRTLLQGAGIALGEDEQRGYDHGVFVPFSVSYPKADIPILQISMKMGYDVGEHLALGRALAPLRKEGILIVGSGLSFHNLREFNNPRSIPASKNFDAWLTEAVCHPDANLRNQKLLAWSNAPSARLVHPREDHLVPLFVAAGAAELDPGVKVYSDQMFGMEVSGFQFGT